MGSVRFVVELAFASTLMACFAKPAPPGEPIDTPGDGWLDGRQFRKRIEIHPGIAGTLSGFPIAVMRTDDPDLEAHATGNDFVATLDDGETVLPGELVRFGNGKLELWVRIPELADGTAFYLYYGGSDVPATTATWDGAFAGVWHLSDSGNARDSTTNITHLAAPTTETTPELTSDGVFGRARMLDGNDVLDGGDPASGVLDFGTDSFSYSLWVHQTGVLGLYDSPFYKGGGSVLEPGYCWLLGTDGGWTAKVHDGDTEVYLELGPPQSFANRWVQLAAVIDRQTSTMRIYADGLERGSTSLDDVGTLSTTFSLLVGAGTADNPFQGMIDEVRIYHRALEPDWIRAEFENGTNPSFLVVGPEESGP